MWLRARGLSAWDETTCEAAALGGRLNVLQWLRAEGCPWDERTHTASALGVDLKLRKWVEDNGCPRGLTESVVAVGAPLNLLA
jgi:hypothetical protein